MILENASQKVKVCTINLSFFFNMYIKCAEHKIARSLTERKHLMSCNRIGVFIKWYKKQIEALHEVFQV